MTETTAPKELFSFFKYSASVFLAIIVSMAAFWLSYGKELVTRSEARTISIDNVQTIEREVTYLQAQMDKLDERMTKQEDQLRDTLKENTDAITQLKVQIASLSIAVENLSENINPN